MTSFSQSKCFISAQLCYCIIRVWHRHLNFLYFVTNHSMWDPFHKTFSSQVTDLKAKLMQLTLAVKNIFNTSFKISFLLSIGTYVRPDELERHNCHQCVQMLWLFFQYLAFYNNENLPKVMKYLLQFCQILNSYSRNGQKPFKVLPKWRNFAKSGHTEGASKDLVPSIARIAKGICNNITSDL